ncbi:substrate-binding domain-containing protein [Radiobacillus kanasensis]|uniref:substrate-binding domain-containing protein n=1 Tax=Radiobacillus kanasensis TaxID=2844358 RepID=UPI001E3325AF|nr:substrate-binding domain-containing protein [Radiobacillus kanasensis]UFU00691.1 substrate-binding domain-containing protein [Radiobacillus kanasensis]
MISFLFLLAIGAFVLSFFQAFLGTLLLGVFFLVMTGTAWLQQDKKKEDVEHAAELIKKRNLHNNQEWKQLSETNPHLGFIIQELQNVIKEFQHSVVEITRLSKVVKETATESSAQSKAMTNVNLSVSKGAQQQAEDAEKSSRVTLELSDQFDKVLQAIDTMNEGIVKLQNVKNEGNQKLSKTIDSGHVTKEELLVSIQKLESLKESVNDINRTTTLITNIASQTNLLSLNASIEAARAGEAGKGFAVVSQEIRNLSDQSFTSVSEIEKIVSAVNKEFTAVVESIQTTYEKFETQQSTITDVYQAFDDIDENIDALTTNQNHIRDHMTVLNQAKDVIVQSITNIAAVAQETAASTEEAASLSMQQEQSNQVLFDLSTTLEQVVEKVSRSVQQYKVEQMKQKKKRIVFVSNLQEGHPFTKQMIENAQKMSLKYGYEFRVRHMSTFTGKEQLQAIEEEKKLGLDYLILIPIDVRALTPVINDLYKQNVKTICVDTDVPHSKRISFIGTDDREAGYNMGQLIAKTLSGQGQVILSTINQNQENLKLRMQGIQDALTNFTNIRVVGMQVGQHNHQKRLQDLETVIQKAGGFDLIAGIDGDFGNVIDLFVQKHGQKGKSFIGFDNTPDNLSFIKQGILDAVVAQRQILFGESAVKKFYDYESNRSVKEIELLNTYSINKVNANVIGEQAKASVAN